MRAGSDGAAGDVWDRLAPRYRWQEPLERRSLDALAAALDVRDDEVHVDVGTGTGHVLRRLGRRGRAVDAPSAATDTSGAMLGLVPLPGRRLRADATRLPLADGSADVVTAAWLLHLLDPSARLAAVREAARVLRRGGRLGVVVPAAPATAVQRVVRGLAERATAGLGAYRVPRDLVALLGSVDLHVTARRRTGLGYLADVLVARRGA